MEGNEENNKETKKSKVYPYTHNTNLFSVYHTTFHLKTKRTNNQALHIYFINEIKLML